MKKLLAVLSLLPLAAFADLKLATVDLHILVLNHPDYDRNEKFLESKSADLHKKAEAIKAEGESLQAEGKKLMEQYRNPMLNDKAKRDLEKKLSDTQQKLYQIEQRYRNEMMRGNQDIQDDQARMLKSTTDDLRARVEKFAQKKGYDLVLDSNFAVYAKKAFDVTNAILIDMGIDPAKARKGKAKGNESK